MSDIRLDMSGIPVAGSAGADVDDYIALLKPRVMSLVVFTALVGMVSAPGSLPPVVAFAALLAIAVGAGASGALNMWYDADIDAVMARTAGRPIPAGRMEGRDALAFGLILSGLSVMVLGLVANWFAGGLLAFTIFFYAIIYTMLLKRRTAHNIVIGGAAGALPPVVGWVAMSGTLTLEPVVLFAIIFLWTPPHFWALALFKVGDYGRAGIPMLPNVAGDAATRRQILAYSIVLAVAGLVPWGLDMVGPVYLVAAILLGLEFVRRAIAVYRDSPDGGNRAARSLFGYSIFYLFALFLVLLGEAVVARLIGA